MQGARTYIYTTAMPPLLAVALSASLRLFREEGWRREHLRELQTELKHNLHTERWRLLPSETPIQPLLVGGNKETLALSDALRSRGILVPAIRPPTVPKGQARLRISLSAAHSKDEVRMLAETLNALAAER
jgi:8-amino-7-oxononanoate synthase